MLTEEAKTRVLSKCAGVDKVDVAEALDQDILAPISIWILRPGPQGSRQEFFMNLHLPQGVATSIAEHRLTTAR